MSEPAHPEPDVSATHPVSEHWVWAGTHRPPAPRALAERMTASWGPAELPTDVHPGAGHHAERRAQLAATFPDATLVIPTGNFKVRNDDCDYRFRPGSDFYYLTGCVEPDAVLVIAPDDPAGTLYIAPRHDHRTYTFYTDDRYGELWVGPRRGVTEAAAHYRIATAPLDRLAKDLTELAPAVTLRGYDASVDALSAPDERDAALATRVSELRLVKDEFEISQLQWAVACTVAGFEDVVRALPAAEGRGERVVEGIFNLRARVEGNDVGYGTIAASGAHAAILHWTTNDGPVRRGDLLLLDAGVECRNLYTADVTRTMPVSGTFSPAQRRVYELVLAAQEAGIAAVAPGASFQAPHRAAMRVLAEGLRDLGILTEPVEEVLAPTNQFHRRYTLHGTSHMLGLDVHDCSHARNEMNKGGTLVAGHVLTVEPGLYFQANDLTVPEEYRGIGVRIEDDILVTPDGARNLSAALPRRADEIEAWMSRIWRSGTTDLRL